jgi:hypothetical protein
VDDPRQPCRTGNGSAWRYDIGAAVVTALSGLGTAPGRGLARSSRRPATVGPRQKPRLWSRGFVAFSANCSAEEAGCIDHASGRQQPKGDQCKLHDRPP